MAERETQRKDGEFISLKVAASTKIELGKIVAVNASGYAIEASDAASIIVMGIADETIDNSEGSDGDLRVRVRRRASFKLANSGTTAITIAAVGSNVCVEDDETVTTAAGATNDIVVGECVDVESDGVWVYIS